MAQKFSKSHEWVRIEGELAVCGISDHAQDELSDVVFVELPHVGERFAQGEQFGVAESVKAASELYMPIGGEVIEVNEGLVDAPEKVNEDPYGAGWLIKFRPDNIGELELLLDEAAYQAYIAAL